MSVSLVLPEWETKATEIRFIQVFCIIVFEEVWREGKLNVRWENSLKHVFLGKLNLSRPNWHTWVWLHFLGYPVCLIQN